MSNLLLGTRDMEAGTAGACRHFNSSHVNTGGAPHSGIRPTVRARNISVGETFQKPKSGRAARFFYLLPA